MENKNVNSNNKNVQGVEKPDDSSAPVNETGGQPANCGLTRKSRKKPELPEGTWVTAGQIVAIRRRELDWPQEELAWRSGLCSTQISRIERGECIPSVKSIEGLESALGIELYDLFMAEKRRQMKSLKKRKKAKGSKELINNFERELARKKLAPSELEKLLSATLKSVDDDTSEKNYT